MSERATRDLEWGSVAVSHDGVCVLMFKLHPKGDAICSSIPTIVLGSLPASHGSSFQCLFTLQGMKAGGMRDGEQGYDSRAML